MKKRILFVCTGNTCRSPLAEHLLRHKAGERFDIKSAGVAATDGDAASKHVQTLLKEKGIDHTHQAQMVTQELLDWADVVLTMTEGHLQHLQQLFPGKVAQMGTLKSYVQPEEANVNISDPFGGPEMVYRLTMEEIESLLDLLIKKEG